MERKKAFSIVTILLVGIVIVSIAGIVIATPGNSSEATSRVFVSGSPCEYIHCQKHFCGATRI